MRNFSMRFALASVLLVVACGAAWAQQKSFDLHGTYIEGCSCNMVCSCALNGAMVPGCQVIGALIISSGTYGDADLSGAKIAFAFGEGWVQIFVQTDDSAQAEAAGMLGRALFSPYGKIESIRNAEISFAGSDGSYTLTVDKGKVMTLKTMPVLGGDHKTPVTYTNYPDPLFHTIMQGKVVSAGFDDDRHHFTLQNSNSFFNQDWSASGKA